MISRKIIKRMDVSTQVPLSNMILISRDALFTEKGWNLDLSTDSEFDLDVLKLEGNTNLLFRNRFKRISRFSFFFLTSFVDVPLCFQKSLSLGRRKDVSPLSYMITSNLGCGNYERTLKLVSSSLFSPFMPHLEYKMWNSLIKKIKWNSGEIQIRYVPRYLTSLPEGSELSRLIIKININSFPSLRGDFTQLLNLKQWAPILEIYNYRIREGLAKFSEVLIDILEGEDDRRTTLTLVITGVTQGEILESWYRSSSSIYEVYQHSMFFSNYFDRILNELNPIFSYFIYKTSKTVWKFSRRKAERFFVMWKYVPPYKRRFIALRWLKADLDSFPYRKIEDRFSSLMEMLVNNWTSLPLLKRKTFIHNYVFREYRFSLLRTYRTQK